MLSSVLPSSSSALLESVLIFTPGSPRFSVAGRLSYLAASNSPHMFFTSKHSTIQQPESDIGLQSPGTISAVSDARVTYSDLAASSSSSWDATPDLGVQPRTQPRTSRSSRRRSSLRMDVTDGKCASIEQVMSTSISDAGVIEIRPMDLFHRGLGVGLGLSMQIPVSSKAPRSASCQSDESRIVPIIEVPKGSLAAQRLGPDVKLEPTQSHTDIPTTPRRPSLVHSNGLVEALRRLSEQPTPTMGTTAPPQTVFTGLGLGLGVGPHILPQLCRNFESDAEETEDDSDIEIILNTKSPEPVPTKAQQHEKLGRGFPRRSRLRDTRNPDTTSNRTLFIIPEARSASTSRDGSVAAHTSKSPEPRAQPGMSPIMLLAAQSFLEEDKKFRKKEGLGKADRNASPTMKKLVEEVKAEEERLRSRQTKKFGFGGLKFRA
ncbi:hypothetical protein C8F01DRAFT_1102250 [Mycena amicta]|nr:hypothetical protein C8F01DRAFT_1102250 [Mycena amicta]